MIGAAMLLEWLIAALLVVSGMFALAAALGLARGRAFFDRLQLAGLAYTGAIWSMGLAAAIYFSWSGDTLSLRPIVLAVLLGVTTPIPTVLLARAALFRLRQAHAPDVPPPLQPDAASAPEPPSDNASLASNLDPTEG